MALTDRQKALRRLGVGASEIAALVGLSRWATPAEIWRAKVYGHEIESTYSMELGTEMEAPIAKIWARKANRFLARVDTLQHPERPFALATPDRAVYLTAADRGDGRKLRTDCVGAERLLEVKSSNWRMRKFWGDPGTDSVPDDFLAQAQWAGWVAGVERIDFAVDFDKRELLEYTVRVRPAIVEGMYEIAERFFTDYVVPEVMPPPDASEAYAEVLRDVFPRQADTAVLEPLDPFHEPDVWQAIELYAKLQASEKRIKAIKQKARNTIENRIGFGVGLRGSWGQITWKGRAAKVTTDWRSVAGELHGMCNLLLQHVGAVTDAQRAELKQVMAAIEPRHTKESKPIRTLRPTWKGDLEFKVDMIALELDRVEKGLDRAEEVDVESTNEAPTEGEMQQ